MRLASGKASWCGSKCGVRAFLGLRHEAYRKFAGSYDHHGFKSMRCVKGDKIQVDRIAPGWWPQPQIQHGLGFSLAYGKNIIIAIVQRAVRRRVLTRTGSTDGTSKSGADPVHQEGQADDCSFPREAEAFSPATTSSWMIVLTLAMCCLSKP